MRKILIILSGTVLAIAIFYIWSNITKQQPFPIKSAEKSIEIAKIEPQIISTHNYHVANAVSFRGGKGKYWAQTKGVLLVNKVAETPGENSYTYGFVADVHPTDKLGAEIAFPAVHLMRNKTTDRFVGGDLLMGNLGLVANATLNQVKERMVPDGVERRYPFEFRFSGDFPSQMTYRVVGRSVTRKNQERVILALAVSDPFTFNSPEGNELISAEHRVLSVMDEKMDQVYFQADRFTAMNKAGTEEGVFSVDNVMVQMENGNPLNLSDMEEELKIYYLQLGLSEETPPESSNIGLPIWAMHSLAVRDLAGITAGSAIEGKPNFVITATVGLVLLADSAVSAGTGLLKEFGVIDWSWKGIPNYIGQGVGLVSAMGIESATGQTLDKQKWKDFGGLAGTIASLFIPSNVLGSGVQVGSGGIKVLRGVDLAGKKLRLSSEGLEIIRGGKGWIDSVRTYEQLNSLRTMMKVVNIVLQTAALSEKYPTEAISEKYPKKNIFGKRKIAFCYDGEIYLINEDGTERINISNTPDLEEEYLEWSPDGDKIAFRVCKKTYDQWHKYYNYYLGYMDLVKKENKILKISKGENFNDRSTVIWSPDSNYIAMNITCEDRDGRGGCISIYDVKNGTDKIICNGFNVGNISFTSRRKIIFNMGERIVSLDIDGYLNIHNFNHRERLEKVQGVNILTKDSYNNINIEWLSKEEKKLFESVRPTGFWKKKTPLLYRMNIDGTEENKYSIKPIKFKIIHDSHEKVSGDLFIVGSKIYSMQTGIVERASVSPEGDRIVFTEYKAGQSSTIYISDIEGKTKEELAKGWGARWQPIMK